MEDVLRRLGNVETGVTDLKAQVARIEGVIPSLATKEDVASLEATLIKWMIATALSSTALAFTVAKFVH